MKKFLILSLKKIEIGSAIAVRLTKYTGKSETFIHPKHFLDSDPWYTKQIGKNDLVLDLGSGSGQSSIKTAKYCKKVVAVEINKNLIEIAKIEAKKRHIKNIEFKAGNLEKKLAFKNSTFDKIIFLDVLEHLVNRDQILSEIHRILKPNGILFVGVPNSQTSWKKLQRSVGISSYSDPDHKIEFSEENIRQLLKKNKFRITKFNYGKSDTPFRGIYDIIGAFSIPSYRKISDWRQAKGIRHPIEASGFEIIATPLK